jgi:hypothetical protein
MKNEQFVIVRATTPNGVAYEKAQSVPRLTTSIAGWTILPPRLSNQQRKDAQEHLPKK